VSLPESTSRGAGRGAAMLTIGTVASGVLAYAFNVFTARTLGPEDYGPIAVLWAALFLISVVLFRPVEQTLSRGISERAAHGLDSRPVLTAVARITALITAVATIAVIAAWNPLSERMFAGHDALVAALAVGIGGYALSFLVRGLAGGLQRFDSYGVLLLADGGVRLVLALPLVFVDSLTVAAAAVAAAAIGGALAPAMTLRRQRGAGLRSGLHGAASEPFELGHAFAFAAPVAVIAAADQILVSGGALLVALTGGPGAAAAAGTVFAATMLVRAPVFLFQGFAAALLPRLTQLQTLGDEAGFRRLVTLALGGLLVFGGALAAVTLAGGAEAMRILYGSGFDVDRIDLTLLAAGVGCYLAAATLSQAALARGVAGRAAAIWATSATTFIALELLLGGSPLHRVSLAFAAAAVVGAALLGGLVLGRAPARRAQRPELAPETAAAARA
jgi:O-antigen/teichoic acid export membrane protein